jgi:hypothetical protein
LGKELKTGTPGCRSTCSPGHAPELIIAVGEELAEAVKFAEEKEPASSA